MALVPRSWCYGLFFPVHAHTTTHVNVFVRWPSRTVHTDNDVADANLTRSSGCEIRLSGHRVRRNGVHLGDFPVWSPTPAKGKTVFLEGAYNGGRQTRGCNQRGQVRRSVGRSHRSPRCTSQHVLGSPRRLMTLRVNSHGSRDVVNRTSKRSPVSGPSDGASMRRAVPLLGTREVKIGNQPCC